LDIPYFEYPPETGERFIGWVENVTVIDSIFNGTANGDLHLRPYWTNPYKMPVFLINSYSYNITKTPVTVEWLCCYSKNSPNATSSTGDLREYVWLDVLVKNESGNPIEDAYVTAEVLEGNENVTVVDKYGNNRTSYVVGGVILNRYPALAVNLPPPPPEYEKFEGFPPMPSLGNLTSIQTLSDGHTPPPNYGWSNDTEPTIALMFQHRKVVNTSGYPYWAVQTTNNFTYRIYAGNTTKLVLETTNYIFPDGNVYTNYTDVTPDESWYRPYDNSQTYQNTTTLTLKSYNLTNISVTPETGKVIAVVNTWNPPNINFTANTTNGNNVNFTICSLNPNTYYQIKRDGTNLTAVLTNPSGCLTFNNSNWTQHIFTLEEATGIDNPPSVTLNSPTNQYSTQNQTIIFNCSASDDFNLINITLYGNWSGWHANETNSSGINGNYLFTKTLPEGSYTWNCKACDNNSQCSFAVNHTLTIDNTHPII
jgi:hypothetical protein